MSERHHDPNLSDRRRRIAEMARSVKHDDDTVEAVLDLLEQRRPYAEIAHQTGVSYATVSCIKNGKCYTHVA